MKSQRPYRMEAYGWQFKNWHICWRVGLKRRGGVWQKQYYHTGITWSWQAHSAYTFVHGGSITCSNSAQSALHICSSLVLEHDEHNQLAQYVVLCILSFPEKAGGLYCALRALTSMIKNHCKVELGRCVMQWDCIGGNGKEFVIVLEIGNCEPMRVRWRCSTPKRTHFLSRSGERAKKV